MLVFHDLLGLQDGIRPKFVRRYASLKADGIEAIAAFAADVRSGAFPSEEETYHLPAATAAALGATEPASVAERDEVLGLYGGATITR